MPRFYLIILLAVLLDGTLRAKSLPSRTRRNAYRDESYRWPYGVVPYTIADGFTTEEKLSIRKSMWIIQSHSCIKFKPRKNEAEYLEVVTGTGCKAVVGYKAKHQTMTLGRGCRYRKLILHELYHVLGFFHEHTRPDRDEYVKIMLDNVKENHKDNFLKWDEKTVTTLGLPYDFRSIVHYHDREWAMDRKKPTIVAKSGADIVIGQASDLSKLDIQKLNRLYHCKTKSRHWQEEEEENEDGSGLTELEDNYIVVNKEGDLS